MMNGSKSKDEITKKLESIPEVSVVFYKKLNQYGVSLDRFLSYAERIKLRTTDVPTTMRYWQQAKRIMKTSSGDFYSVTMFDVVMMKICFEENQGKLKSKSIEEMKAQLTNQRDTQLSMYGEKVEDKNLRLVSSSPHFDDDFYVEKGKELDF